MASSAVTYLRRLSRDMRSLPRQWIDDSVKTIRKAATKRLGGDTGGDRSLSNAPGKLRVEAKVSGDQVATATITPGPRRSGAQWSWLEEGTQPHRIGRGRHPGTSGKQTWTKGTSPAVKAALADGERRFSRAVNR